MMITIKRYIHIWHVCLVMMKVLVDILVTFLQLTNWILDSLATCHMSPQVSDFIPGSLENRNNYIRVADGHYVTINKKGKVQIIMLKNNRNTFIATLHNILLAPDLCNKLFSIIKLMNLGHTCLFQKGFCTVYFGDKKGTR